MNILRLDEGEIQPSELIVVREGVKLDHTGDSVGSSLLTQLSR